MEFLLDLIYLSLLFKTNGIFIRFNILLLKFACLILYHIIFGFNMFTNPNESITSEY